MTIDELNQLTKSDAGAAMRMCCTAEHWIQAMVSARPFLNKAMCLSQADKIWNELGESDYLQAFDGHPKIGDVNSLKAKYANTKALASGEQSAVAIASDEVLNELAEKNQQYLDKFGFIFIVCATGKSAEQMLELLNQRLPNNRELELKNAAEEQRKIFQIRLEKLL